MISSFKDKLNAPASKSKTPFLFLGSPLAKSVSDISYSDLHSTTPEGSPGPNFIPYNAQHQQQQQQQPPQQASNGAGADTSSILKALADMAKQNTPAPAAPAAPAPANPLAALNPHGVTPQPVSTSVDQASQPASTQAGVNPYAASAMAANPFAALGNMAQNPAMVQPQSQSQTPPNLMAAAQNPLAALLPQSTAAPAQPTPTLGPDALQQQLQLLQLLAAQGIPQDQWATALQILTLSNATNMANMPGQPAAGFSGLPGQTMNAWGSRPDSQTRDLDPRDTERDYMRSPPGHYRRRSRSPGWDRRRDVSPPRRRDSPIYGEYHGDSPGRRGGDARGRRDYRQRSPQGRRRRSPSPRNEHSLPPPGPKLIEWDYSIGQGNMKGLCPSDIRTKNSGANSLRFIVLSRTLFVGGVTYVPLQAIL